LAAGALRTALRGGLLVWNAPETPEFVVTRGLLPALLVKLARRCARHDAVVISSMRSPPVPADVPTLASQALRGLSTW
jgi:hypothetical protein